MTWNGRVLVFAKLPSVLNAKHQILGKRSKRSEVLRYRWLAIGQLVETNFAEKRGAVSRFAKRLPETNSLHQNIRCCM
jgi:hypothetical protein